MDGWGHTAFRWLGIAGIELSGQGVVIAIDPFFSRPPFRREWLGRVLPYRPLVAAKVPRCDYILVSHSHWDHLIDVPEVVRATGALAMASARGSRLLSILGAPEERVQQIQAGDTLPLGGFRIQVLAARHRPPHEDRRLPGLLPREPLPQLPPAVGHTDADFSFLIEAGELRLLHWNGDDPEPAVPADLLFLGPQRNQEQYGALLRRVRPKVVIPVRWDEMVSPPIAPSSIRLARSSWSLSALHAAGLSSFKKAIRRVAPTARVFLPDPFQSYRLDQML